jgi:uncharacterized membrane protein
MIPIWWSLIAVVPLFVVGAWLSYSDFKESWWFPWVFGIVAITVGWVWAWACRNSLNDTEIYRFSLVWDAIAVIVYSVLPLLFKEMRIDVRTACGIVLILTGAILVKTSHT